MGTEGGLHLSEWSSILHSSTKYNVSLEKLVISSDFQSGVRGSNPLRHTKFGAACTKEAKIPCKDFVMSSILICSTS